MTQDSSRRGADCEANADLPASRHNKVGNQPTYAEADERNRNEPEEGTETGGQYVLREGLIQCGVQRLDPIHPQPWVDIENCRSQRSNDITLGIVQLHKHMIEPRRELIERQECQGLGGFAQVVQLRVTNDADNLDATLSIAARAFRPT